MGPSLCEGHDTLDNITVRSRVVIYDMRQEPRPEGFESEREETVKIRGYSE